MSRFVLAKLHRAPLSLLMNRPKYVDVHMLTDQEIPPCARLVLYHGFGLNNNKLKGTSKWCPPYSSLGATVTRVITSSLSSWDPVPRLRNWSYLDAVGFRWWEKNFDMVMVCEADKNLGTCICDTDWVAERVLYHLREACEVRNPLTLYLDTCKAINDAT
eukprot:884172-Amphidinium_carterae.1